MILFCADPLAAGRPDPAFADEAAAAARAGLAVALLSYEELRGGADPRSALRRLPFSDSPTPILYRGWMLPVPDYARLAESLAACGYQPITDPQAYRSCHELPAAYPYIVGHTPPTIWLPRQNGFAIHKVMDGNPLKLEP